MKRKCRGRERVLGEVFVVLFSPAFVRLSLVVFVHTFISVQHGLKTLLKINNISLNYKHGNAMIIAPSALSANVGQLWLIERIQSR